MVVFLAVASLLVNSVGCLWSVWLMIDGILAPCFVEVVAAPVNSELFILDFTGRGRGTEPRTVL